MTKSEWRDTKREGEGEINMIESELEWEAQDKRPARLNQDLFYLAN